MKAKKKVKMKTCAKCKKEFPATHEYFRRNSGRYDRLDYYCKSCARVMGRKYTKAVYDRDRELKGILGARCPLWTQRCGQCFRINTCWRIKSNKFRDLPTKLVGPLQDKE